MQNFLTNLWCGLLLITSGAWACSPALDGAKPAQGSNLKTIESINVALVFRTLPDKIIIGQHFALELALCANDAAAVIESVRVDAHMPEHRHGMNYKVSIKPEARGRYRAQGLMFHMPGRWEYIFEVRVNGTTERLTTSMVLQ